MTKTEYEKVAESRARAAYEASEDTFNMEPWGALSEDAFIKHQYRRGARATMEADRVEGYALVPLIASEAMKDDAWVAYRNSTRPAPYNIVADAVNAAIAAGDVLQQKGGEK